MLTRLLYPKYQKSSRKKKYTLDCAHKFAMAALFGVYFV